MRKAAGFCLGALALLFPAAGSSRHAVLVVLDGMRPDFVQMAPTLARLARDGVLFRNHHSVYCTATDVNAASLATGCYPDKSGLFANTEFCPAINSRRPVDMGAPAIIRSVNETSARNVPSFVELLRSAGRKVALVGAKSPPLLFDRHNDDWLVVLRRDKPLTIFAGAPLPSAARAGFQELLGPFFDDPHATAAQRNQFATRALIDYFWRDDVPDFSLLWLSEPDLSEHEFSPGSAAALAAIKAVDEDLALLLKKLEEKKARDSTDILVVSDHGFSTIKRSNDMIELLRAGGFDAGTEFSETPRAGDILVAGNGGSVLFYVRQQEAATTQRLVDWLQHQDFSGVIFAREKLEGTFALADIRIETSDAPDVVMAFRAYDEKNQFGIPGMIDADWNRKAGQGTHATLGRSDVNNLLIASGPSFRKTPSIQAPTGNIDLAPTILEILGVKADGAPFDGRSLLDLPNDGGEGKVATRLETRKEFNDGTWQQHLVISKRAGAVYFDSGAGAFEKK